jgi:hypothetical protein
VFDFEIVSFRSDAAEIDPLRNRPISNPANAAAATAASFLREPPNEFENSSPAASPALRAAPSVSLRRDLSKPFAFGLTLT